MSSLDDRSQRVPPHSEEAERGVLGSALIEPERVVSMALREIKLTAESFYIPSHRILWQTLCAMIEAGDQVDLLTVGEKLKQSKRLDQLGGYAFLEGLIDSTPTSSHAEYYAGIVRSKWILREAAHIAYEIQNQAHAAEDAEQFLAAIPGRFLSIADGITHEVSRSDVFNAVIDEVRASKERQDAIRRGEQVGPPPYVTTPWEEINKAHGGGLRNYLYMLAGEQSTGKTTLAAQLMKHVAVSCGRNEYVLLFSMDADAQEHAARDMSAASRVSLPKLMGGWARREQVERFADSARSLTGLPIVIDEECSTLGAQVSRARMLAMRGKVKLVVVDYIQLSRIGDHKVDQDQNYALSAIAKGYKRLARELGCPVVALSQLNNNGKTMNRFAMMQDLRGSGELAEVPHGIWLLSKDRDLINAQGKVTHHGAQEENHIRPVWLDVAKNKNGPIGKIEFWLYAHYFTFIEAGEGAFELCAEMQGRGEVFHKAEQEEVDSEYRANREEQGVIL